MALIEEIRAGELPEDLKRVAKDEGIDINILKDRVLAGEVVIPHNVNRKFNIKGIGKGLTTKINANIGTSPLDIDIEKELKKVEIAEKYGADSIMDLSTGGNLPQIRKEILAKANVMVGSVPVYRIAVQAQNNGIDFADIDSEIFFDNIERECEEGIDFITVHCGITKKTISYFDNDNRLLGIVSRGGSLHASWIKKNNKENPLYSDFDRLLKIAKKYNVTLSLGDGLRPGCIADATDSAQISELIIIGELAKKALEEGVMVMIEGPGHVPIKEIEANILLQKKICNNAPFYVLGPLPTDIAMGYDHITSAIGGAIAASAGADFLCYVTPAEHIGLPGIEDVKQGVIASKIAAHIGDIAKGIKSAIDKDNAISHYRKVLDWDGIIKNSIDPEYAKKRRDESIAAEQSKNDIDVCSMCGDFCAIKIFNETMQ